ncbi:UNVERIFIED_CONTAM: hypothetical protein PYX00_002436 [Menopon gallinae]|uniref:5'-nucleotidase domain-containing protein 3 n=1 Tax=Menopon gallinae TaxID=328185 RepID=A0AAW2IHP3_9NEOP
MLSRQLAQSSCFFIKKSSFVSTPAKGKWENGAVRYISKNALQDVYRSAKEICFSKKPPRDVNPKGVFACNELDLSEISVYGFDYDYTLACYKPSLDQLLYDLGRDVLVKRYMYPKAIKDLEYRPDFTIRGLHYDIEKGLFMKLDSFLQIQFGTVYRGLTPIPDDEVITLYKNKVVPIAYAEAKEKFGAGSTKLYQLADLFSRPEMGLLCNITEYFEQNHIDYHPEILFRDVRAAIGSIHPVMHEEVVSNTETYLEENPEIRELFVRLHNAEKKLFLITNSPFKFVNVVPEHELKPTFH